MGGAPSANWLSRLRIVATRLARPLTFVCGLAAAAYFIRDAGIARVGVVVETAGVWLPLVVLLQLVIVSADAFALRHLLQDAPSRAPFRTWLRATAMANACSVFLPAGRAAGEAVRGSVLAGSVGAGRAARAALGLQVSSLLGTATACAIAALVTRRTVPSTMLPALLAISAGLAGSLALTLLLLARSARVASTLRRLFARALPSAAASWVSAPGGPTKTASAPAYLLCLAGRSAQAVQYGVAVSAIGGRFDAPTAIAADGIQLVASTAGDLLPGQLGALEAAYTAFAGVLGLPDAAAGAIALVLIMRGALVGLALGGLCLSALFPWADARRSS